MERLDSIFRYHLQVVVMHIAIIEKTKQTKKGRKKLEEKFTTISQTDV